MIGVASGALGLAPTAVMLAVMVGVSVGVRRGARRGLEGGFLKEYFIGGRSLGGFVLAMTTVATYSSVSSFVGGPGAAWNVGFGWVYMSVVQVTVLLLGLGILGKKLAVVSRRIDAVTIVDVLRHRYGSDALAYISAAIIVLFFAATMTAQFVGGARLFEAVTGYSYTTGLAIFGVVVVLCTVIGGFRGVAVTDAVCAIAMLIGMGLLLFGIIDAGGGYAAIMDRIAATEPRLLTPLSDGMMPVSLYISQWLIVGIFTIGLPQTAVRCMSFRDTRSLHSAIVVGTVVIGAMNIGMNLIGVLSRGVLPGPLSEYGTVDSIIPLATVRALSPALAGVTIIGPIAASVSTISSLLLSAASSIVKDIYARERERRGAPAGARELGALSQISTLVIGLAIFAISMSPPDVIWKINMFAFGGLESAFIWVLALGLFWRRANRAGALLSVAGGAAMYCAATTLGLKPFGIHQIAVGAAVSLALFALGSWFGRPSDESTLKVYF